MGFKPHKRNEIEQAIRAGLIALERGSRIIGIDDWAQARKVHRQPPTQDERKQLKLVSVSDEVVRKVADERSKSRTALQGAVRRWVRLSAFSSPSE